MIFARERKKNDLSPIDVLRKRNRKESSEKKRERERAYRGAPVINEL